MWLTLLFVVSPIGRWRKSIEEKRRHVIEVDSVVPHLKARVDFIVGSLGLLSQIQWCNLLRVVIQVNRGNNRCRRRVIILSSPINIQGVLIVVEITVVAALVLVVLVLLMVKEVILLNFFLKENLVLVKLLHRYREIW